MPLPRALSEAVEAEFPRALEDLKALVRIPSVSARGEGQDAARDAVARLLECAGLAVEIWPTKGPGVVFAEGGSDSRTLLFYNHYDVQPEDPVSAWHSPPFTPEIRDGRIYGRGTADNKGDLVSRIAAIRAFERAKIPLPCRVKFLVEGDEEIGSPSLPGCVRDKRERLAADACLWESSARDQLGHEMLMLGVKGILCLRVECRGPGRDLHSSLATSFENPAWRLLWALAALKDASGRIRIPGFHDGVEPPCESDLAAVQALPDFDEKALAGAGARDFLDGLRGVERRRLDYFGTTLNISGLTAGYQGPGSKTVLPSKAEAKVDIRLVLRQDPARIVSAIRAFWDEEGFRDVEIASWDGYPAARTPVNHPAVKTISDALEDSIGRRPLVAPNFLGSGPLYLFEGMFPTIAWGIASHDAHEHSPNEWVGLDDLRRGIRGIAGILLAFGGP